MNNPLITIIIPSYNDTKYVKDAIASAQAQTYENIEIIVVNDGSTGADKQFFDNFPYPANKIKLISKQNEGLAMARNSGIQASKGEFFIPLDADDKIAPDFAEKTLKVMLEDERLGVVYTDQQFFEEEDRIMPMMDFDFKKLLVVNHVSVCSLVRRKAYDDVKDQNKVGYNPNMKFGYEDWDFWISVAEQGWEFKCIHKPLFFYRKRGNSMSSNTITKHGYLIAQLLKNHSESFKKNYIEVIQELQVRSKNFELQVKDLQLDNMNNGWIIKKFIKNIFKR